MLPANDTLTSPAELNLFLFLDDFQSRFLSKDATVTHAGQSHVTFAVDTVDYFNVRRIFHDFLIEQSASFS